MKQLTILLLLVSNLSFAQTNSRQEPSQFDKFINLPQLEWAAYLTDTIRFTDPPLNKLLD